uniref:J domain-containing protein n=1 Tax=Kalanchoe fedtschenkoi TaxID=63787 RepID=A0A7N0UX34_KALFE
MQSRDCTARDEAERLLSIAAGHLESRNLKAARDHALSAQDLDPLLEGADQIVAITDVLLAAEKRVNNHHDWYAILQIERRSEDVDLIKKQYRRLAFSLHPDKNRFHFADQAFKLVADAWSNLSDPQRKSAFDSAFGVYTRVDLVPVRNTRAQTKHQQSQATPSRRSGRDRDPQSKEKESPMVTPEPPRAKNPRFLSFWTACPYCYVLHQYPKVYEGCCLTCQTCNRTFEAVAVRTLPPLVPGKEAYYCCWGVFPVGFANSGMQNGDGNAGKETSNFPKWMPQRGSESVRVEQQPYTRPQRAAVGNAQAANGAASVGSQPRRGRGRPRKNPI